MKRRIQRESVRGLPKMNMAKMAMHPITEKLQETKVKQAVPSSIQALWLSLDIIGQCPHAEKEGVASSWRVE
jgi:hypothetical protein